MRYSFSLSDPRFIAAANNNFPAVPYVHPDRVMEEHDFLYIVRGEWEVALFSGERYEVFPLKSGDLLVLPAGLHHYGTMRSHPPLETMYIHATRCYQDKPLMDASFTESRGDRVGLGVLTHAQGNARIARLFNEIIAAWWGEGRHRHQELSALFTLLLCEMETEQTRTPVARRAATFIAQIEEELRYAPQLFLSVPEAAARFGVTAHTLNRRFKAVYGKTFHQWQLERKLDMARQLLKTDPRVTVREAALSYGFEDEFYFSRAFKRQFGIPPKKARE